MSNPCPPLAVRAKVRGVVILEAVVDRRGRVEDVSVLRSIPLLDRAAIAAVRQWHYSPLLLNGRPGALSNGDSEFQPADVVPLMPGCCVGIGGNRLAALCEATRPRQVFSPTGGRMEADMIFIIGVCAACGGTVVWAAVHSGNSEPAENRRPKRPSPLKRWRPFNCTLVRSPMAIVPTATSGSL